MKIKKRHPLAALGYAEQVVSGGVIACKWTTLSCQRFLDDLSKNEFIFNESEAQKACNFIETLPHVKGRWAGKREAIKLEPWQQFIVCNIFGWYGADGRRRFNRVFLLVSRKNAKSTLAAGIGLYCFVCDGEFGAEVYSGATSEKQAWEVFRPAKQMVERTAALREHFDISVNAKSLTVLSDGSRFEPLIGKPGDGGSPSLAIVDEYHEHDSDDLYQTMETGQGARENPLMLVISTAGSNLSGPCHEMQRDVERVLEYQIQDDALFAIIYCADSEDSWDSDDALYKANPNIDVSVSSTFLKTQRELAKRSAIKQAHFRTKHLNEWVGSRSPWMNMLAWQRQKKNNFGKFSTAPCHIAVDLASRKDVSAVVVLWKDGDEFYTKQWFYVPESAMEENDKYMGFSLTDDIVVTPGNKTDQEFIEGQIIDLFRRHNVLSVAFDDFQGDYIMTRLMNQGVPVINYNQVIKNMSTPMKHVEAEVNAGKLYHDGNRCMTWMVGNVTARQDFKENIYPRKENDNDPRCKIDGPVALIMAMGRWLATESEGGSLDDFLNHVVPQ